MKKRSKFSLHQEHVAKPQKGVLMKRPRYGEEGFESRVTGIEKPVNSRNRSRAYRATLPKRRDIRKAAYFAHVPVFDATGKRAKGGPRIGPKPPSPIDVAWKAVQAKAKEG